MNPKKTGTLFIVLIIALLAFGTASAANVAHIGTDLFKDLNITKINLANLNGQQITPIGDTSFKPAYVTKKSVNNTTNGNSTNNTGNNTSPYNQVFGYQYPIY